MGGALVDYSRKEKNSQILPDVPNIVLKILNVIFLLKYSLNSVIYSQLSRHSTARESNTGLVPVGPTKVKAHKSILFTYGTPEVEIMKSCHICIR